MVFTAQLALAIFSLFPSPSYRASRESKRLARESRWAHLDSPTLEPKVAAMSLNEIANAPQNNSAAASGALNPMTPRTLAFNRLGGTKDLPLRNHFGKTNDKEGAAPKSPKFSSRFGLRSSTFPRAHAERKADEETATGAAGPSESDAAAASTGMYFPPPPKVAVKGAK